MKTLICHILYGDLPYRKERRARWPVIALWAGAWAMWGVLVALWWLASTCDVLSYIDK